MRDRTMTPKLLRSWLLIALLLPHWALAESVASSSPALALPGQWSTGASAEAGVNVPDAWWKTLASPELDSLVEAALQANHDLAAAVSRIAQARAAAKIAQSSLLPALNGSVSGSRARQGSGATANTGSSSQALLTLSYDPDLWGLNASLAKAAEARVAASEYDRDAVALALQSEVALDYLQMLALQDGLVIAHSNLDAARKLADLVQVRFDNGASNALDVAQQQTIYLNIKAEIPALEQSLAQTRNALATLLGRPPQGFAIQGRSLAELSLPAVDAGRPAALLERRPDIQQIEARLVAAGADIQAARAALYPSINLSLSAGIEGFLSGGSSFLGALAASLVQTIFDGGKLQAQVALTEDARAELVQAYLQAVLVALKEVEDNLSAVTTAQARTAILTDTVVQAREAYRLATIRYEEGNQDLLTTLDSQRSQLSAEANLVQARLARYTATVGLIQALGG